MYHRGISTPEQQKKWLDAGWEDTFDWSALNDDCKMEKACSDLMDCIQNNKKVQVITDSDCDGWGASAILLNYLYSRFQEWAENNLSFIMHEEKQHGFADLMDRIDCDMVISPDGGTNDIEQHRILAAKGIKILVLDHHLASIDIGNSPANIINVQCSNYPNKALTGGGVVYRFISAFEDLFVHGNQPTEFMDLCALSNCGDMADYRELEIRAIINIGFSNIKNPFLYTLCQKHKYTLDKRGGINYLSMAFAAVPFINALTRSGTPQEQEMVFKGMLTQYAFEKVESSKRGEKGIYIYRYQEAVTTAERVKRRQDKLVQETTEILEKRIQEQDLTQNAIIVLLCEPNEVEANIAGLIGNKIQAKYQHPTLVLRRTKGKDDKEYVYRGSARNYSFSPVKNMRTLCESTEELTLAAGHEGAWGCAIPERNVDAFIQKTNELYKDVDFTPAYMVDFIWTPSQVNPQAIIEIAELDIWGQEMPEATVVVKDIPLSENNVSLIGLAKGHPTIKINCNGVEIMKFGSSEEEYEDFIQPNRTLTIVATCGKNEWNGKITPQLLIQDYALKEEWIF